MSKRTKQIRDERAAAARPSPPVFGDVVEIRRQRAATRAKSARSGYWYTRADIVIREVLQKIANEMTDAHYLSLAEITKRIDAAYPFGVRENWPYKCWLKCRRHHLDALSANGKE